MDPGSEEAHVTYANSVLFEKSPLEAMEALAVRRDQIKSVNKEMAEWFTAYGRQRLKYVEDLKKLHAQGQRLFSGGQSLDPLGLLNPLWSDNLKLIMDEITLFDQSTRKMGRDMIAPLKLFNRNNDTRLIEMDEISELASNIQLAQENGQDPTQFVEEWSRRAPDFFATFESYDYERLVLLKDVFSKYQSDASDVNAVFKTDIESGLAHVLNLNVEDEIERFSKEVIQTHLPIEHLDVNKITANKKASRTTADGFTNSSTVSRKQVIPSQSTMATAATESEPHHRKGLFHKKDKKEKRMPSTSSSLFSNGTTIGPGSAASVHSDKKDKGKMRSKFGSIFKKNKNGHPNGKKMNDFGTINESDSSSIVTGNTHQSFSRQRTHSISSNNRLSMPNIPNQPAQPSHLSVSAQQHQQQQQMADNRRHSALPVAPVAVATAAAVASAPPAVEKVVEPVSPVVEQQQQQHVYEPMVPTKKNDSISSLNTPVTTPSVTEEPQTANDSSPTTANTREMNFIPEDSVSNIVPPPLPTSRKQHVAEPVSAIPQRQQSHGQVPMPPPVVAALQKRQSVNGELQPAATGSKQLDTTNQTLASNTTGGGSLANGQIVHPSLTTPGLNASIVELFNASFKDGELVRSNAIGEIAFSFINEESTVPSQIIELQLKSNNNQLPNFMVNPMFLEQISSAEANVANFKISDVSQLLMRTVGGLKYMLSSPLAPIVITPVWKHEPTQSTVIISIKPLNSSIVEDYLSNGGVIKLTNVLISASIQGAIVSTAATKPSGTLNKDKGRVTWLAKDDVVFSSQAQEVRYVARFITNQQASESEGGVQVKFNIGHEDGGDALAALNVDLDILAKGKNVVEDPFGDNEGEEHHAVADWVSVPTLKSIVSGSYTGHS